MPGPQTISLGPRAGAGTVEISSAARRWERVGGPVRVTWFPVTQLPAAVVSPAANRVVSPLAQVRLTFSRPVADVVGAGRPRFSLNVPGSWRTTDSHTIVFTPTGLGFPLAAKLRLELPRKLALSVLQGDDRSRPPNDDVGCRNPVGWGVGAAEAAGALGHPQVPLQRGFPRKARYPRVD
jgi:hypothetical protein